MTRQYRDICQYQNGASITSSSATLTLGNLLTGRGLAGLPAPFTLTIQKSDGTNREVVNVKNVSTFPQLGIDRALNGTAAVSHDTTELVTMDVGENDFANFVQSDDARLNPTTPPTVTSTPFGPVCTGDSPPLMIGTGDGQPIMCQIL